MNAAINDETGILLKDILKGAILNDGFFLNGN